MAGLSEIPVVILEGDDLKAAQVSIIENIQRENLNPVEEALAYRTLMERFDLTQDQVSQQVGKSRSNIANMMRLLDLPESVLDLLREGLISADTHARCWDLKGKRISPPWPSAFCRRKCRCARWKRRSSTSTQR